MRHLSLGAFLFFFWLALSGHYTPVLMGAGAASAALCVLAAARMRTVDAEGHPIELFVRANPRLPISPTMTIVHASQGTRVGVATYANSITLTPGTITVAVDGNELTVHALVREGADDLESGGMDHRVSQFTGAA
jgi:multicomponent Na+:H+ antiporter subunit E